MKDFSLPTLWTIAEEFFGTVPLWIIVILGALFLLLFLFALIRQQGFHGSAARTGVIAGIVVGVAAAAAAPFMTQAGYGNLHGAVDWIALVVIGVLTFIGVVVVVYGVLGFGSRV